MQKTDSREDGKINIWAMRQGRNVGVLIMKLSLPVSITEEPRKMLTF